MAILLCKMLKACNKYRLLYGGGVPLCHIGTRVAVLA